MGYYGFGTFIWTETEGYKAWMTNSDYWPIRRAYHVSADGTKWAGLQYSLIESNLGWRPFVGTESSLQLLDSKDGMSSQVLAMSPNGEHLVGLVELTGVIWSKKKARSVSDGTNIVVLIAVTDSGVAAG